MPGMSVHVVLNTQTEVAVGEENYGPMKDAPTNEVRSAPELGNPTKDLPASVVALSSNDRRVMMRWARSPTAPFRLVLRSRIVLMAAAGKSPSEIARTLGTTARTVRVWRERFAACGIETLRRDAPGRGRKSALTTIAIDAIVAAAECGTRPDHRRWTIRSLAAAFGTNPSVVFRVCRARGIRLE